MAEPTRASASESAVVDASVLVDLLAGSENASVVHNRLRRCVLHAPAHIDAEVLSALGRLYRAGALSDDDVTAGLARLEIAPLKRHPVAGLVAGAWLRRDSFRLVDAVYVELAARLQLRLLTTDLRLARSCSSAEVIAA